MLSMGPTREASAPVRHPASGRLELIYLIHSDQQTAGIVFGTCEPKLA